MSDNVNTISLLHGRGGRRHSSPDGVGLAITAVAASKLKATAVLRYCMMFESRNGKRAIMQGVVREDQEFEDNVWARRGISSGS